MSQNRNHLRIKKGLLFVANLVKEIDVYIKKYMLLQSMYPRYITDSLQEPTKETSNSEKAVYVFIWLGPYI